MFEPEKYPANGTVDDGIGHGPYTGKHGEEVVRVEVLGEESKYGHTQRKLKSRHIQLIALGKIPSLRCAGLFGDSHLTSFYPYRRLCAYRSWLPSEWTSADLNKIGTGLFVGSGATLSTVGPAPFFMAFVVMSFVIWAVMNALAEMTTYMPVQGASAPYYVKHFFEPSLAFAAGKSHQFSAIINLGPKLTMSGWNYWYAYSMLVAAEISAASVVLQVSEKPLP